VVRHGIMAKAASSLAITQSAISKTVAEMEHVLGVPLLDRTPRGVEVTAYGEILMRRAFLRPYIEGDVPGRGRDNFRAETPAIPCRHGFDDAPGRGATHPDITQQQAKGDVLVDSLPPNFAFDR
jgi:hypothetical protein